MSRESQSCAVRHRRQFQHNGRYSELVKNEVPRGKGFHRRKYLQQKLLKIWDPSPTSLAPLPLPPPPQKQMTRSGTLLDRSGFKVLVLHFIEGLRRAYWCTTSPTRNRSSSWTAGAKNFCIRWGKHSAASHPRRELFDNDSTSRSKSCVNGSKKQRKGAGRIYRRRFLCDVIFTTIFGAGRMGLISHLSSPFILAVLRSEQYIGCFGFESHTRYTVALRFRICPLIERLDGRLSLSRRLCRRHTWLILPWSPALLLLS